MTNQTVELVEAWRRMSPAEWCEGPYGWIDITGLPITLTPWQRAVIEAWWSHRAEVSTLAISNVKKTGKTFLNAVLLCWRWLALPGMHFAAGNDLDQSTGRQFAMISEMVRRNEFLSQNVKVTKNSLTFEPTGSTLQALALDAAGAAGANHLTASHTEAWGIVYEAGIRLFEELTPPPGRVYDLPALRVVDSYAGYFDESKTWHDLVDRGLVGKRVSKDWPIYQAGGLLLFHIEGREAQKRCFRGTQNEAEAYYYEQKRTLRSNAYLRLHENRRVENVGNFCNQEDWDRLIDKHHKPLAIGSPHHVFVGMDLAVAPGGDNAAVIGVYFDQGKVKVAFHKVWKGAERLKKLSLLDTVAPFLLQKAKDYKIEGVYFDPWQSYALAEHLRKAGLKCVEVTQTHSNRGPKDTLLYEMVSRGVLVLYENDELRHAPSGANVKELGNGMIFLQKASGRSKIDLLVALSNVASECQEHYTRGLNVVEYGPGPLSGVDSACLLRCPEHFDELGRVVVWSWKECDRPVNQRPHPAGVTWKNCPHRVNGCQACVNEQVEDGSAYEQYHALEDVIPMSDQELGQFWAGLYRQNANPYDAQAEKAVETFRKSIQKRMAK